MGRIVTDKFDFAAVTPAGYPPVGSYIVGFDTADDMLKKMDSTGTLTAVGGATTFDGVLAGGAATNGYDITLTNGDLFRSSNVSGSRLDFGASGDELNLKTSVVNWIVATASNLVVGDVAYDGYYQVGGSITPSVNQMSIVSTQTYLYHGTRIVLDTPALKFGTSTHIDDFADTISIDANNRGLYLASGIKVVDWFNGVLDDSTGITSCNWENRFLTDNSGVASFFWTSSGVKIQTAKYFTDFSDNASIDSNARILMMSDGVTAQLDWAQGFLYNDWKVDGGNLGVGITPTYKLHVQAPTATGYGAVIQSNGVSDAAYFFFFNVDQPEFYMRDTSGVDRVAFRTFGDSWFTGGNVGIGTDTPTYLLHAKATTATGYHLYVDSFAGTGSLKFGFISDDPLLTLTDSGLSDQIQIATNGTSYFNGGNVAFGQTTALSQVDVLGATGYSQFRMQTSYTPTGSADANGNVGEVAWDTDYIYIKTAVGAWKRAALVAF